MYRMSMMAFVTRDPGLDTNKCIKMALVHDVAESIVGDITPFCGISKEEKRRLEADAMQQIQTMLGENTEAGKRCNDVEMKNCVFSKGDGGALEGVRQS